MKRGITMRKYGAVVLALIFVISTLLCGCSKTNDETAPETNTSTDSSETIEGEIIDFPEDLSINWGTGEAELSQYMIAECDGRDILVLYLNYTNLSEEPKCMLDELSIDVFQKRVQIDLNNSGEQVDYDKIQDSLKQLQKGASISCTAEYVLPNTEDPLTIKLRAYDSNDEEVSAESMLQLSDAVSDEGDSIYAEKSDLEKSIKDGASINWGEGEATLTGYAFEKGDGNWLNLYFDYSNFDDQNHSFSDEVHVTVFQDGVEQEYGSGEIDYDVYNRIFSFVQNNGKVHCAMPFILNNDKGPITLRIMAYDADYNEVVAEQEITIK